MKFTSLLVFLNAILLVKCGGYKFLKIDKCAGPDKQVVNITVCEVTSSSINATFNIPKPLNKIFVNFLFPKSLFT